MRYSTEVIEDVKEGNDIIELIGSYTQLTRVGNNYKGICPFHTEKTPSFNVSAEKQLYHCFGCGASGTVYNFIQNIENLTFVESLQFLADRINYDLPITSSNQQNYEYAFQQTKEKKRLLYEIHTAVARKYYENLNSPEGVIAKNYLDERKLTKNIRIKYGLGYSSQNKRDIYMFLKSKGYAEDIILESGLVIKNNNNNFNNNNFYDRFYNRLMFPIIDTQSRIIGFGGRDISGNTNTAKYLNSPDTIIFNKSKNLYGLNFAKNTKIKELILVEGYIDVLALAQVGIQNVVASLGTAFNQNHVDVLKKYVQKVIILFDSDTAGLNATEKAISILVENNIVTNVAQVKEAKDPDEYIQKWGVQNFISLLNNSKSYTMFRIQEKQKLYNLSIPTQKLEFLKEASKIIALLQSPLERDIFIKETSKITGIQEDVIQQEVKFILPTTSPIEKAKINIRKNINYNNYNNKFTGVDNQVVKNNKLNEAIISILFILYKDTNIRNKLRPYIIPENFMYQTYIKVAELILNSNTNNNKPEKLLQESDIVLSFSADPLEQALVSKIFLPKINFFEDFISNIELEKIINNQFRIIKSYYYNNLLQRSQNSTDEELKAIIKEKKYYENLYIKI